MIRSIRRWLKRHNPFAAWHAHTVPGDSPPRLLAHRHTVLAGHSVELAHAHPDLVS